jgi:2,4-dienoyl-CoA reductase-like NADH-dependent reductase (Old Yellow Enzyme family)
MVRFIVERSWADKVALGRALIVGPGFPNKMLERPQQ